MIIYRLFFLLLLTGHLLSQTNFPNNKVNLAGNSSAGNAIKNTAIIPE